MGTRLFGKIFQQMYESSLAVNWKNMVVFQQMIVLADRYGVVDMTHEAIARRTNMPLELVEEAIKNLEKPDSSSRNIEEEGRRIVRLDTHRDWGWRLPAYRSYSNRVSREQKREADRDRMREKRAAKKRAAKK